MSTFVFAPSWVTYPNHPTTTNTHNNITNNTIKKEEIDEFPTLLSNNNNSNNHKKKTHHNNSVWSNSRLIQKIYHEEEGDDTDYEEKRYELERLKALVPKTKKSLSASSSLTNSPKRKPKTIRYNTQQQKKPSSLSPSSSIKQHHNTTHIEIIPTTTTTSTTEVKEIQQPLSPNPKRKDYISEQEQLNFMYFIKSWTSTGITSNNQSGDYSYFCNNSHSSCDSTDSGFHSDTTTNTIIDMSSRSFFQYDPFPINS